MEEATKIRIISSTTTFYPLENEAVEAASKNDNLTLWSTLQYLKRELNEEVRFFRSGKKFVVLQQWRDTLFVVETTEDYSPEVLRMLLQTTREILIFLFGQKFESVMGTSISLTKRQVFAKYIETYLNMCKNSYLSLIGVTLNDTENIELGSCFNQCCEHVSSKYNINLISMILFNNHSILSIYTNSSCQTKIDPETLHILQIFEMVEFSDEKNCEELDPKQISPEFVENNQRTRVAFLRIERCPVGCTLSCFRLGENSPLVLLCITQNVKLSDEMRQSIKQMSSEMAKNLSLLVLAPPVQTPVEVVEGLIHSVVIDRSGETVMELPPDVSLTLLKRYVEFENESDAEACLFDIKKRLSSYAMSAMMKGFTSMIWGEMDLQFSYQLKFRDENGIELMPTQVFQAPSFDDDNGVNYSLIASSLFPESRNPIRVYEILTIYSGTTQVRDVYSGNQAIFSLFLRNVI